MPGPFAEWAFRMGPVRWHVAFEHDLGIGGEGEPGDLTAHHLHGTAAQAADEVELEHAIGRLEPSEEEGERIAADHHCHRQRLAALERLVAVDAAVVAGGHDDADGLLVVHLRAVGAGIEPVLLRIAGDAVGAGAEIASAVLLMPLGRGEFGHVDIVAHHDVLEHGSVLDDLVRDDALLLEIRFAVGVTELPLGELVGKAERHVAPLAGEHVEQEAEAFRRARDVLEHHAGPMLGAQHRFRRKPDILLAIGALHGAHLAQAIRHRQPFPQVVIRDVACEVFPWGRHVSSRSVRVIAPHDSASGRPRRPPKSKIEQNGGVVDPASKKSQSPNVGRAGHGAMSAGTKFQLSSRALRSWLRSATGLGLKGRVRQVDEARLSARWREASLRYVSAVNALVQRGLRDGWENVGPEPEDDRQYFADDVLAVVRRANATGDIASLRERFPPAHEPFLSILDEKEKWVSPIAWIDNDRIAVGMSYGLEPVVVVSEDGIVEQPGVRSFGRCPNGRFFARAFKEGVEVCLGWDGLRVVLLGWPTGREGPPCEHHEPVVFTNIRQLAVFPDGKRVLVVTTTGLYVLAQRGATLLFPTAEAFKRQLEDYEVKFPGETFTPMTDMPHGAISPRGDLVLAGCQQSKHLVFNAALERIAQVGPREDSPHFAWFSADGELAAFNSCNFYSGTSIGVLVSDLPGLDTPSFEQHPRVRTLEGGARVYAAVARGDEFIIGDAGGYLRAFDMEGRFRWQHFVGSTICALDLSPDKRKLAVSTYAGILCVLQLDADEPDPFAIGTASHREIRRWLFWKGEGRVLKW